MANVLLEIGTEEMPSGHIPPALAQLAELAHARLTAERITFGDLQTWGTPRRIALYLTGVAEQQSPAVREVRGPAAQDAFAINGEPTQAAIGFARSQNLSVHDLRIKKFDDREYVVAVFPTEGRPLFELLPTIFNQLIAGITFPTTMRWGTGRARFARPIRWLVALMDEQIVPLTLDAVTAGRMTRGHRFLAPGEVEIPTAADYPRVMDENQILVDPAARRASIAQQLAAIAHPDNAVILDDGALLEKTTFQLEYPTAVRGAFDPAFLALPREVLIHVLRDEQDFFPLADAEGALLPAFIGVRNGDKAYLGNVREGYERVVHAKLLDAQYFFEQDCRQPLAERAEALRGVIFQERLGTMYDKAKRLESFAGLIAAWCNVPPETRQLAERAAYLAKADLVTAMVIEYPTLQGHMGAVYAGCSGEPAEVATAIAEHYRPRTANEPIPASFLGKVVALADKLDTVAAGYVIGLSSSGSEDPYGVRREANGIMRILADGALPLTISQLLARALRQIPLDTDASRDGLLQQLEAAFRQRLEYLLTSEGFAPRVIKAVLATEADTPASAKRLARFLQDRQEDPSLLTAMQLATRVANMAKHATSDDIDAGVLREPAECALFAAYQEMTPTLEERAKRQDYAGALALLIGLAPTIERFFAEILVMSEDPTLRQARLALCARLTAAFRHLGNLTVLG
ncbi:MAG TPA: glycine--tRNA ligase subunit beta [Armatimonadota bacterium]|jgi:glycyl-tRNA synthetase beta chain